MSKPKYIRMNLGPGGVDSANVEGRNYHVVYSAVDVEILIPGGEFTLTPQGGGIDNLENGETFKRVTIRNPSLATVTVILYVGGPLFRDSRLDVVEPKTVLVGWNGSELPDTSGLELSGLPAGDLFRRKSIQVTNLDPNLRLQVLDSAGNVALTVFPQTSITLPISEFVEIWNDNGAPVACNVSEIWWSV